MSRHAELDDDPSGRVSSCQTPWRVTRLVWAIAAAVLAVSVLADEGGAAAGPAALPSDPQIGDCVIFREGGAGLLLRTPVYWLRGSIAGVSRTRRMAQACPRIGKQAAAYTPADHARLAAAMPCVDKGADAVEVDVTRVQVSVEDWETPWSPQQGTTGWLFRGRFLEQTLKKGEVIDMDTIWLLRCAADG